MDYYTDLENKEKAMQRALSGSAEQASAQYVLTWEYPFGTGASLSLCLPHAILRVPAEA